jgi:hypothetical protein
MIRTSLSHYCVIHSGSPAAMILSFHRCPLLRHAAIRLAAAQAAQNPRTFSSTPARSFSLGSLISERSGKLGGAWLACSHLIVSMPLVSLGNDSTLDLPAAIGTRMEKSSESHQVHDLPGRYIPIPIVINKRRSIWNALLLQTTLPNPHTMSSAATMP